MTHLEGDYLAPSDLSDISLAAYDNIVMPGSDRLDTKEAADARTLLGYYLVQEILELKASRPDLLVELFDPDNVNLVQGNGAEVLVSPVILSHILAHVALRPELNLVFSELFGSGGAEIFFKRSADYGLAEQEVRFGQIQQAAAEQGDIALGVCLRKSEKIGLEKPSLELNPARDTSWSLHKQDDIVVLSTVYPHESAPGL